MTGETDPNKWMAEEIFKKLSGLGHKVYMYDEAGQRVVDPTEANRLFSADAKMMVTLGWTKGNPARPHVTFHTSDVTDPTVVEELRSSLKNRHNLYDHSFSTMPYGKTIKPKNFAHMNAEPVNESAWTGSTRTSRWRTGLTEVVIRHNQRLDDSENARRWTRIADIFIHGKDGSRYKFPFRHIMGAKAMAQHMDQGHAPWDENGSALACVLQAVMQLRKLKRWAAQNRPECMDQVTQTQQDLKSLLHQISTPHGYPQGMDHARDLSNQWQVVDLPNVELPPETDLAVAAVGPDSFVSAPVPQEPMPVSPEPTMFREAQQLENWFAQFDVTKLLETDAESEIEAASADTASTDPRTVLDNLSRNITGWESRFEENPMEVLNQIDTVLDQIKNLERS